MKNKENNIDFNITDINIKIFDELIENNENNESILCKCFNEIYKKNKNNLKIFYEELWKLTKIYKKYTDTNTLISENIKIVTTKSTTKKTTKLDSNDKKVVNNFNEYALYND